MFCPVLGSSTRRANAALEIRLLKRFRVDSDLAIRAGWHPRLVLNQPPRSLSRASVSCCSFGMESNQSFVYRAGRKSMLTSSTGRT